MDNNAFHLWRAIVVVVVVVDSWPLFAPTLPGTHPCALFPCPHHPLLLHLVRQWEYLISKSELDIIIITITLTLVSLPSHSSIYLLQVLSPPLPHLSISPFLTSGWQGRLHLQRAPDHQAQLVLSHSSISQWSSIKFKAHQIPDHQA